MTAPPVDDPLVEAFLSGSHDGLKAVYDSHQRLVHSFCRRTLSAELAADATQETFLAAWRSRDRYRPDRGALAGWLIGIARFKVIDIVRTQARQRVVNDEHQPEMGLDDVTLGAVAERMVVADALEQLPDRAQMVVRMAFFEGLTHQQISQRTDIALGTVKSDIRRSLDRLRQHLGGFDAAARP